MGDLDFEELDKAVNNLMSKAGSVKGDEDIPTTLSIDSTLQPGEGPNHGMVQAVVNGIGGNITDSQRTVMQNLQATPQPDSTAPQVSPGAFIGPVAIDPSAPFAVTPLTPEAPSTPLATPDTVIPEVSVVPPTLALTQPTPVEEQPRPVVPRPTSGRFMDVVHPSSDMKSSSGPALVVPPRKETAAPQSSSLEMPDTPEFTAPVAVLESQVVPQPAEGLVASPVVEDALPLTPFLPDANAKVEKRPLGTSPDAVAEPEISEISATPDVPVVSPFQEGFKPSEYKDTEDSQPINGEFNHSVSKGEKGEDQRLIDPTSVIAPPTAQEKALQSIESTTVDGADNKQDESVRAVESGDTGHLSNGKAPGELGAAESSEDKTGDIFDVKNNHPAIHPIKQRSGWLTIVIVVLVIIVCVGIAAAAYYTLGLGV